MLNTPLGRPLSRSPGTTGATRLAGATGQKIGSEPVRYVRNIVKYYVAYRQILERQQAKAKALEQMQQP